MSARKEDRWELLDARREYKGYILRVTYNEFRLGLKWEWRALVTRMEDPDNMGWAKDEKEAKLKARRFVDGVRR